MMCKWCLGYGFHVHTKSGVIHKGLKVNQAGRAIYTNVSNRANGVMA